MKRGLGAAAALLLLAGCHGDGGGDTGTTPSEAAELDRAAASIDINATAAPDAGGSQENGQ